MASIRHKAGAWYSVELRDPRFSLLAGVLGTKQVTWPRPELGDECICCDAATTERQEIAVAAGGRLANQKLSVSAPCCIACKRHMRTESKGGRIVWPVLAVAMVLLTVGVLVGLWKVAAVGAALLAMAGAGIWWRRTRKDRLARRGHRIGFEVSAVPGECTVRTMNPRVVREIVGRAGNLVHKATLEPNE